MKDYFVYIFLIGILSVFGCEQTSRDFVNQDSDTLHFELIFAPEEIEYSSYFEEHHSNQFSINPHLMEISGIVQSVKNQNSFWLHEDSGSDAEIYLYSGDGNLIQKYKVFNVTSIDYEDISIGFGPQGTYDHIYLGDIGDNRYVRDYIYIHRFPEPFYQYYPNQKMISNEIESYAFKYNDGAQNCEAFFLDPISGDLYVFTKNIGQCKVYTSPFPFSKTNRNELKLIGKFDITGEKVTAADISNDGNHVAVKSYNHIFYWDRTESEKLVDMFKRLPTRLPYNIEPQGEAFCWKDGTESYLTISESNNAIETRLIEYKD